MQRRFVQPLTLTAEHLELTLDSDRSSPDSDIQTEVGTPSSSEEKNPPVSASSDGYDSDELEILTRVPVEDKHIELRETKKCMDDFYVDYRGEGLADRYAMSTGKILYYVVTAKNTEGNTIRYLEACHDVEEDELQSPDDEKSADKSQVFIRPPEKAAMKPVSEPVTFFSSSNQKLQTIDESELEEASQDEAETENDEVSFTSCKSAAR